MQPIQDLLNRIRWDREFSMGRFEIGYYDRVEDRIVKVALADIEFPEARHSSFRIAAEPEKAVSIPLHRVRKVWKNGVLIWERKMAE